MKYIINNCPQITPITKLCNNVCPEVKQCKDISDCLLKQIIDKCDSNISKLLYEGENLKLIEGNKLASEILQIFDLEEC